MIYTVTFNPALDYMLHVPAFAPGRTNRATDSAITFGGKGINVSLILRELCVDSVALGFVAGFTGEALTAHLRSCGLTTELITLPAGMTRINVKLTETGEGEAAHAGATEINAPGPDIPASCLDAFWNQLERLGAGDTLVLAGSVPPSIPHDIYARIMGTLAGRGIRFAVDATGEVLRAVLPWHPFVIKPNLDELEELFGLSLRRADGSPEDDAVRDAAARLQAMGAINVLVSMGGDGALLLDETGKCHRAAAVGGPRPGGAPSNTVGAGDSMLAGFLAGVTMGRGYDYALRLGLAAGGATAGVCGLAGQADILALMD